MSAAVSWAGSSAVSAGLTGLQRAGEQLQRSADEVLGATTRAATEAAGCGTTTTGDTVALSDVAQRLRGARGLEAALLDGQQAVFVYTANARVIQGADAMQGSLLSVLA